MEKRLSISPLNFISAKKMFFLSAKSAKSVRIAKWPKSANFLQHIAKSTKSLYSYCKLNLQHERWFSALIKKIGEF